MGLFGVVAVVAVVPVVAAAGGGWVGWCCCCGGGGGARFHCLVNNAHTAFPRVAILGLSLAI